VNAYLYDAEDRLCAVHGAYGMVGYQYDAEGNRISKGSITVWSCDITSNGFQPQSDYILDQGGGQETEMAVAATGTEVWQHTNVWADGQLIATYNTERLRINELLPWNVSMAPTHTNPQNTCPHKIMWARIPKPPPYTRTRPSTANTGRLRHTRIPAQAASENNQ